MSRSSLWVMDKDYKGYEVIEFSNSWLFSPVVWDALLEKYMNYEIQTSYGYKKSLITNPDLFKPLNEKVNDCKCTSDRICWELSNQQVFFTKDKQIIAKSILDFLTINSKHGRNLDGKLVLQLEHIVKRFNEIADEILKLDEFETPYFIFKNTSCDDGVEYWFSKYDEESDECIETSLSSIDKIVTEFVFIDKDEIVDFQTNINYFKLMENTQGA